MKSIPIPGNTDRNAFENNVNWKYQNRLKQSYEIGNKKCRLKTLKIDWRQQHYIGNYF